MLSFSLLGWVQNKQKVSKRKKQTDKRLTEAGKADKRLTPAEKAQWRQLLDGISDGGLRSSHKWLFRNRAIIRGGPGRGKILADIS